MNFLRKLFGFKPKNKLKENKQPQKKASFSKEQIQQDQQSMDWVVESIIQYSHNPRYKNEFEDFIETNCIIFEDKLESSFEQTDVHKKYIELVERKLKELIKDLNLTEQQLFDALQSSYNDKRYKRFIERLINTEDFLMFKKMMIRKNKQLEKETKLLMLNKYQFEQNNELEDDNLEDESDINYAIELSKKMQEEYQMQLQQEQQSLEEALRQSEESYRKELEEMQRKKEELEKQQLQQKQQEEKQKQQQKKEEEKQKEIEMQKERELAQQKFKEENLKKKQEIEERMKKERMQLQQRLEELKKMKMKQMEEQKEEDQIVEKDTEETVEKRKAYLQEQRQKLLKLKKNERQKLLKNNFTSAPVEKKKVLTANQQEQQKRKQIYDSVLKKQQIYITSIDQFNYSFFWNLAFLSQYLLLKINIKILFRFF